MFTNMELDLIVETLKQRRDWLNKQPAQNDGPVVSKTKALAEQLDTIIGKLEIGAEQSPGRIRILVVEDDQDAARLLSTLLEGMGLTNLDYATDGLDAINRLFDTPLPYHCVFCDWDMPVKNGLEVLEAMQTSERYRDSRFVMVTGMTQASQIREAVQRGVDEYLVKPLQPEALEKKLTRLFPAIAVAED